MAITFAATPILKVDETSGLDAGTQDVTATRATLPTTLVGRVDTLLASTTWDTTVIQFSERANAITGLGPNATDVAFTNSDGTPLVGVDSGLVAISGRKIFLYTDTNNNLVIGREGNVDGTANAAGSIALLIYMETNGTGAQGDTNATAADLWVIELTTIQHYLNTDPQNPNFNLANDFVSLTNKLFVQVSNPISFNADKSPSGNNLFITYADGTPGANNNNTPAPNEFGVVVTAVGAANTSAGESLSSGPTVKTSQAGAEYGGATFGVDSQMVDPPQDAEDTAEALYFTFVKGITPNYTVPNLSPTEADVEANIQFQSLVGATKVSFQVVQLQPASTKATMHIDALVASTAAPGATNAIGDDTPFTGNLYIDNQETNTSVNITKVTIDRGGTKYEFAEGGTTSNATADLTLDFSGDGVDIKGLLSGDKIIYETAGEHDRLQITNIGNLDDATYNSSFDVGSLVIESGGVTRSGLPDIQLFDDGPNANGTPVTATVDEDGTPLLAGANTNAALGDSNAGSTATGSIAGIFNAGRDGLQTFQLNTVTSGLAQNLTSQGGAILYHVDTSTDTLIAYVNGSMANYQAADDREVFTLDLSGTNNSTYTFTLIDQLDHPLTNDPTTLGVTEILFEDDLTLNLGTILQIKDGDNDVATGDATDLVITLDDDSPVINGSTNLVYSNSLNGAGNPGGTGKFDYSVGVDDRDAPLYSALNTDLLVTLSGFVGNNNNPLTAIDVDWLSETDLQATFQFDFTYISNPSNGTTTTLLNNTIVFDKVNDTYTVHLVNPISSFSVLTLADPGAGFSGYEFNSTTPMGGIAGVTTAQLAGNFFVQFRGFAEPSGNGTDSPNTLAGNGNLDALDLNEGWTHPDDDSFTTAIGSTSELFTLALPVGTNPAGVSISGDSAGTNSDTMQSGEVLDFTLYSGDPQGLLNPGAGVNKTTAGTIFIEFDQLSWNVGKQTGEDMVVVLKLVDANNPNITTTRAIIVQASDIYHAGDTLPAGFGFTAEITGNNGMVIIEQQDYNFGGTDNWVIQGAQVLASTEGVTSTSAIDLDRDVGAGGASTLAGPGFSAAADSGNGTTSTWDSDVFKIVNIGFVTNVSPDATLNFGVQVVDRDGDTTASQTLVVNIEADSTFAGTNSADTFVMRDIPADLDLALSQETRTIGGFDPAADLLDFTTAGSVTNFVDGGTNNTSLANLIANAETALDDPAVIYYFARFGGNGYLAYDADADGLTALVKLTGVTSGFTFDDII